MSNAVRIKESYKLLLSDKQPHYREEMFSFAKGQNIDNAYTEGMLGGALKTLVDKEKDYVQVERGVYQFIERNKNNIFSQHIDIFENALEQFDKINVDPFKFIDSITEGQKEQLKHIQSTIEEMRKITNELQEDAEL